MPSLENSPRKLKGESLRDTLVPTEKFAELNLTSRQSEILLLAINGVPSRQIALDLDLKLDTVRSHLRSAFIRIDDSLKVKQLFHSRTATISLLSNNGFIEIKES